jgi:hypothetical protein
METKINNKKGKCINTGPCSKANSEEKQIISDPFAEFICSECGQALQEIVDDKTKKSQYFTNKKIIFIIVTLLVILGIYFGIMKLTQHVNSAIIDKGIETVTKVTAKDEKIPVATKENTTVDTSSKAVIKSDEKEVANKDAKNEVASTNNIGKTIKGTNDNTRGTEKNMWRTLKLPNGDRYVGEIENGVMHGAGTYYFSTRQIISKKDLKKRYAEAGDVLKGNWNKGNFSNGKLYDKNDSLKYVIIIGQ